MDTKTKTGSLAGLLIGASLGATAMYFLDPHRGNYRRALVRDKLFSWVKRAERTGERLAMDLKNRAVGTVRETKRHLRAEEVDDKTLAQRIRSEFGRKVSHAKAIEVKVENGDVRLSGPILKHEVAQLIACVESVPGVKSVRDELSKYDEPGDISSLQGRGAKYFQ